MKKIIVLLGSIFCSVWLFAASGYNIKVSIEGYRERKLSLAYYFGNQQYIKDTTTLSPDGTYTFKGSTPLQPGIYILVLMPDNIGIDFLVSEKEQHFSITTTQKNPHSNLKFVGSKENELFQTYLKFVSEYNPRLDTLRAQYKRSPEGPAKEQIKQTYNRTDSLVQAYLKQFLSVNRNTYAALVARATIPIRFPVFTGTEEEKMLKNWHFARKHCFDNVPLQEFRLLRTPHYFQAINQYVSELLFQHPDSLIQGIDFVLSQLKSNQEAFEYFTVHFLRQYLQPKLMGMDAVFVHLVEKYLESGAIKLSSADQQRKLIQMAQKQKPLLIGKVAPNIALKDREGKLFNLHDINAEYTLFVIWAYDCGHCKHAAPFWKTFYEKYKDRGIKFVALCHVTEGEIPACWKYVDQHRYNEWLNVYDPQLRYIKPYNVETTPQVFLLDRNKVIIGKQIVAETMEKVVDQIIDLHKKGKI